MRRTKPIEERFWPRVEKTDACWNWTGYVKPDGHGELGVGRRGEGQVLAHVYSFRYHGGTLGPDQFVLHHCDNGRCVNPEHLYAGTKSQNLFDAYRRGRRFPRYVTQCPSGHEYNEENTYVTKIGKRMCKRCGKDRYEAKKASR